MGSPAGPLAHAGGQMASLSSAAPGRRPRWGRTPVFHFLAAGWATSSRRRGSHTRGPRATGWGQLSPPVSWGPCPCATPMRIGQLPAMPWVVSKPFPDITHSVPGPTPWLALLHSFTAGAGTARVTQPARAWVSATAPGLWGAGAAECLLLSPDTGEEAGPRESGGECG